MMKTSEQGVALICEREGLRLEAYLDTANPPVATIGVGHTAGVQMGDTCTREQALEWLADDLRWAEAAVNEGVKVPLEQHQFDALVSFTFNVGQGAFLQSTLLRRINAGDMAGAAAQFDRWHIPASITSRRNGEKAQFQGTAFEARI